MDAILKEAYRRVGWLSGSPHAPNDYRTMKFSDLNIIHEGKWVAVAEGIYIDPAIVNKIKNPPASYVPSWYSKFKSPIDYFEDQNSASYAETLGENKSLDALLERLKDEYNLDFNH